MSVGVLPAQAALLPPPASVPRSNNQHSQKQTDAHNAPRPSGTATTDTAPATDAPLRSRDPLFPNARARGSMNSASCAASDHAAHMAALQAQHTTRGSGPRSTRTPVSPYNDPLASSSSAPFPPPPPTSADPAFGASDRPPLPGKPPRHGSLALAAPLGGVQKKKSRFSRSKRRSLGKSKQAAAARSSDPYTEPGPPALADLRNENRRKTKRHFRGGAGKNKAARARAAAMTPGGGLFPITPKIALGAPTVSNEALMGRNKAMAHLRSCTTPVNGALTPGERGILGISSPFTVGPSASAPYDPSKEAMGPGLDFFGSNEGLIRPVGSPSTSASASDSEMSDSGDNNEGEDTQLPVLRGMELNMGEAENQLRQRQQELRINDQAGYIVQLEDDNLKLRGQLLTMEEELEKLRRLEDEHLNMQERLYLLEEELAKKNESNQDEDLETPRSGGEPEPRVWER